MRRIGLLLLVALAGCGGSGDRAQTTPTAPDAPMLSVPTPPPDADLPQGVPTEADGPAPAGAERVVRAWASAVRRAKFERAADLFATGAQVQNGGPVERLEDRRYALVWNAALPCGAQVTRVGGADGYAIAEFRLVDRVGSTCGSGTGNPARVAFRIRAGKITGWYRLPSPQAPSGQEV